MGSIPTVWGPGDPAFPRSLVDRDASTLHSWIQLPHSLLTQGLAGKCQHSPCHGTPGRHSCPILGNLLCLCLQNYLIPGSTKFSASCREEASTPTQSYYEIYAGKDRYPDLKALRKESQTPLGRRHCHLVSGQERVQGHTSPAAGAELDNPSGSLQLRIFHASAILLLVPAQPLLTGDMVLDLSAKEQGQEDGQTRPHVIHGWLGSSG